MSQKYFSNVMEIADYIPDYPDLTDPHFNDRIFHKKEFYDLRTGTEARAIGERGDLWPHQKLLGRIVSPYTSYDEQLLFHSPGTGKTCGAAAIIEVSKQDPLVRKPVLIIVPNDTLVNQWKQQLALICTSGHYIPEYYFSTDPIDKLTAAEKTTRINKLLSPIYRITTLERMRRHIDNLHDTILRNRYSNTIIIIDEVHNLRIQVHTTTKKKTDSQGRYKAFHRFLHLVENSKKILLTGTPMFDRIGELPGLMNLILPLDQQLPIGVEFSKKFLTKERNVRKLKNVNELYTYLIGKVSYIREGGSFPLRKDLGEARYTKFLKTLIVNISKLQLTGYLQAYKKDTEKETNTTTGLWKNSRQAAVFVYKTDKDQYLWGTDASSLLMVKGKVKKLVLDKRVMSYTPVSLIAKYTVDLRKNLKIYSAKYAEIVDFINKHQNEPIFIFTPLVTGAGGAIFLGLVLELFGYSKAMGSSAISAKRYAIITGDDKSSIQRKKLIEIFNSPKNTDGKLIQIMIATKTISEGTSFVNVRNVIVVSPYWNNSGTEQAIGRGLRADSLVGLPKKDRVVTVQELAIYSTKLPEEKNIDAHMYKMSESKDFEIKNAERVLKKAAWDCALNYARNVRTTDINYTRNCDYQKCNYVCYQTTPKKVKPKWVYSIPEKQLDESTYLLYYSQPELLRVVEKIKNVLGIYSYIDIRGLNKNLNVNSFKLLILAIEYIIENHVTVYNKWGQACFLRKDGNMLFLSDIPTEKEILGSWYARYPYANQQTPLSMIIDNELYAQDLPKLDELNCSNSEAAQKIVTSMNLETKIFVLETLLKMDVKLMAAKQKKLYDIFRSLFDKHIFIIDDTLIHNLEKTKLKQNYVNYTMGDGGSLRCLRDGRWENCGKKVEEELSKIIKEIKDDTTEEVTKNPSKVYGIISSDGKFLIADKTKEKKTTGKDKRNIYRGRNCRQGWQKWQLIELYFRLNIDPPVKIDTTIKKKPDLVIAIKTNKVDKAIPDNATVIMLQKILTLSTLDIKTLCEWLEQWFIDNKLVIKE